MRKIASAVIVVLGLALFSLVGCELDPLEAQTPALTDAGAPPDAGRADLKNYCTRDEAPK